MPEKKLTQAERLREAVKTEYENAQSLLRFQQKEAKAKKTVLRKTTFKGEYSCIACLPRCFFPVSYTHLTLPTILLV